MESDAIGGYFELELSDRGHFPHEDGYCVNSGRNALELILRHIRDISRLWIPYYTCDVILEPVTKLGIQYSFYHVNQNLELSNEPRYMDEFVAACFLPHTDASLFPSVALD